MFDSLKFWKKKEPLPAAAPLIPKTPAGIPKEPDLMPPDRPPSVFADRPDLPAMPGEETPAMPSTGLAPDQALGFKREPSRLEVPQAPEVQADLDSSKDMQLINAKLDAIKAGIDHINARLDRIERPREEKEIIAWR
ncbi:hypothetical protein KY333_02225 [Candidatus Woesearchaeota archaeon]|nr:hypothetical protein [Candidatus Woesearchaeota archaeon]MBW2994673.1 hypothetical protein [Candidatus Woesearchaeota archaeon]